MATPDRISEPRYDLVELKYRDEGESLVSASRLNPLPVEVTGTPVPTSFRYRNIAAQATVNVKAGRGVLHSIVINKATASGTLTLYDNATTATAADKIATITLPGTLLANQFVLTYDIEFTAGLTVVMGGADTDVTVVYR